GAGGAGGGAGRRRSQRPLPRGERGGRGPRGALDRAGVRRPALRLRPGPVGRGPGGAARLRAGAGGRPALRAPDRRRHQRHEPRGNRPDREGGEAMKEPVIFWGVVAVLLALLPFDIPRALLLGWVSFLARVLPGVTADWPSVAVGGAAVVLFTAGVHAIGRAWYRRRAGQAPAGRRW